MSVAGISNSSILNSAPSVHNNVYQFRQEFKKLGQDLKSGDLSAAQADFTTLQQLHSPSPLASPTVGKHPIADGFNQLAQDLQSGNISGAQQDYTNIQQAYQNLAAHRHHPQSGGEIGIAKLLSQLGQVLQPGNASAAQQAYTANARDLS
jgi:hypothetical protein